MTDDMKKHPILIITAKHINEWARDKGITIRELSEQTDVPYTLLRHVEQGYLPSRTTMSQLYNISRFFDRSISELLKKE